MSYAGHVNLVTLQLSESSTSVDSQLKKMLATSLVVHAVLLLGLMSVRFVPTIQHPLASYHVDLVTLPEPKVAPSVENRKTVKRAKVPPPVKPKVKSPAPTPIVKKAPSAPAKSEAPTSTVTPPPPPPQVVEPIQTERIMPSIVDALENVAVPQSREIIPMEDAPTLKRSPVVPERKIVEREEIPLPVVPQAPQLSVQQSSSKGATSIPSVPPTKSLADTLKQAVQSVAIPQKSSMPKAQTSVPVTPEVHSTSPKPRAAIVESPRIITPGQAPQLSKVTPVPTAKEATPKTRPQSRLSDSLKQVTQSVVVSEVRKNKTAPQKLTQAVAVPVPSVSKVQQKPREKLQGMVIPSQAPKLAKVEDVENVRKALPEQSVPENQENIEANIVEPKIAKLVIPEVQVPEAHHILSKPTESGMQNTKTALQISGSSPEGNAYWGRVWSKIDREWVAPPVDVRAGKPLQVVLAFRIERNGSVKNLSIEHSSGNEYYDLAAKRAILDATPLPPFASDMPESFYDIQFQFTVNVDS